MFNRLHQESGIFSPPPAGDEVVVTKGVVKFKNFAVYENYISANTPAEQNPVLDYVKKHPNFVALSSTLSQTANSGGSTTARWNQFTGVDSIDAKIADLMEDTAFVSIINADGIVQIGDYYVQYNPFTEKVLVMHQSHYSTTYQALINKDEGNRNIFVFTVEDDVLAFFEENNFPITPPRGSNVVEWPTAAGRMRVDGDAYGTGGIPMCRDNTLFDRNLMDTRFEECGVNPNNLQYRLQVIYRRYGIRFTLRTRMMGIRGLDLVFFSGVQEVHFHNGNYALWYHFRGGRDTRRENQNLSGTNVRRLERSYVNGSRSLMRLRFAVLPNSSRSGYPTTVANTNTLLVYPQYEIRINYP